jgi:hypothetical protein
VWSRRGWNLFALGACTALGATGMGAEKVPLLGSVDAGIHQVGQHVGSLLPVGAVLTAVAGPVGQLAVPLLLAVYFLLSHDDRAGASVCLGWAATSFADVARSLAEAPTAAMGLAGGHNDWAFVLGPEGVNSLHSAAGMAATVSGIAWLFLVTAVVTPALARCQRTGPRRRTSTPAGSRSTADLDLRQRVDVRSPGDKLPDVGPLPSRPVVAKGRAPKPRVGASRNGRRPPSV